MDNALERRDDAPSIESGAKEFFTKEAAMNEVKNMIKRGIPEPAIRIVQIIPFDIDVKNG